MAEDKPAFETDMRYLPTCPYCGYQDDDSRKEVERDGSQGLYG